MNSNTKFLIIDDFSTMRKILKKTLTDMGFLEIEEAANGVQAWQAIQKCIAENAPIQFVISDWNMPEMSGLELLKKVRSVPELKTLPFVMATAESEQAQILEAIKVGCDDYIVKPFTPQTIKEKVTRVYDKYNRKAA